MITLEKVKFIREKKSDNPDQLNLFGDNSDKKNKKNKAQQYTDKINKANKNRKEFDYAKSKEVKKFKGTVTQGADKGRSYTIERNPSPKGSRKGIPINKPRNAPIERSNSAVGDLFKRYGRGEPKATQFVIDLGKDDRKARGLGKRAERIKDASGGKKTGSLAKGNLSFPGDRTGAYSRAKNQLDFNKALRKARGNTEGDIPAEAPKSVKDYAKGIRDKRIKKYKLPDTSFDAKPSKKPIRPFGQVGRDKAPEGLFGAGDTKGQMTAKRMDTKAFKKTQPTSDLLPKSFKDFDKKIKSLKVDTDIERRISNPKTASIIDKSKSLKPSGNPDLTARRVMGAAGSDSNFTSAEPVPKSRSFKPSKTFIDKVRKSRKSRRTIKDLNKEMGANELIKRIKGDKVKFSSGAKGKFASGSVDLGNTDAKFANRQRIKEPPKFDGQQNIFNDPNFDKKTKNNKRNQRNRIPGGGQKKKFNQLKIDLDNNRRTILNTGRGQRIRAPRTFKQGSVINPEIFTGSTPFDKKNTRLAQEPVVTFNRQKADDFQRELNKRVKDMMDKAKQSAKQSKAKVTTGANLGNLRDTAKFQTRAARLSRGFGGNRGKRAVLGKIAKAAIRNPGKTGLIGAGLAGAYFGGKYLFNRRNDLTKDDIGTTSVIKNKSGKGIDFKYPTYSDTNKGKNKNKEDTGFKNPDGTYNPAIFRNKKGFLSGDSKAPRQTAFQNKFKTGEFKVDGAPKNKDGTAFTLNKNLAGSAFEKQLQQAEKGTGRGYNPFGKNFLKKYRTRKDRQFLSKYKDATRPTKTA